MSSNAPYVPTPPIAQDEYSSVWGRAVSAFLNAVASKVNNVASVTLTAGATTTTLIDPRIFSNTAFTFTPLTANAATAKAGLYVTARNKGQATLNHASNAAVDQTFQVAIHG